MTIEAIEPAPAPEPVTLRVVPDEEPTRASHYDLDAERVVLGAMLLTAEAIDEVSEIVSASHFYRPAHGVLFAALVAQRAKNEPTDPVAMAHVLSATGELGQVGGTPYLHTLISSVPTAANAPWHAQRIAEHAQWRDLVRAGVQIAQLGNQRGMEVGDARNRAQSIVHEATTETTATEGRRWRDLVGPAFDRIEEAGGRSGPLGLPTGLSELDDMLDGLRGGQLVIVAGRPSMGKSIFGVDIARHNAMRHNVPATIFSLEMSEPELTTRILSAESGIPQRTLEKGTLSDSEWAKLARRLGEIGEAPLVVDDSATLNLAEIRAKSRRRKQREGLGMIVVDYVQLLKTPGKRDRHLEVGELSGGLKALGRELDIPVIAACQLNRNNEGRADRRPQLSDLRESGSLEADADIVLLLHRDSYYEKEKRPGEVDVIVAKNRNGPTGCVVACAQLHLTRFVDMAIV